MMTVRERVATLPGFHLCNDHQPDRWESDGTCPICEGHALKQQNERQREIIKQFSDDLVAASEKITMLSLENVTLRTSLRGLSNDWKARADHWPSPDFRRAADDLDALIGGTPQEPT